MIYSRIQLKINSLAKSKFRSKFKLDSKDKKYIETKGLEEIENQVLDFITKKLAPEKPTNDGRQTPFTGHPIFKAQHATATCCRTCISKWHKIPKNKILNKLQISYIKTIIMYWLRQKS